MHYLNNKHLNLIISPYYNIQYYYTTELKKLKAQFIYMP